VEKSYYPIVVKWLVKQGYYCGEKRGKHYTFEDTGSEGLRADVVGIRNVGSWLMDKIELVVVEVKDIWTITPRHLNMALAYSSVAHKCYLATTAEVKETDVTKAAQLGVGLLQLYNTKTNPKELLSPQIKQPNEAVMLSFLCHLGVLQCTLCRCYFLSKYEKINTNTHERMGREAQFNLLRDFGEAFIGKKINEKKYKWETHVLRRYVCKDCCEQFFPHIKFRKKKK